MGLHFLKKLTIRYQCIFCKFHGSIDFKEIDIPSWHMLSQEEVEIAEGAVEPCTICPESLFTIVAQKHHVEEFQERRRFQVYF